MAKPFADMYVGIGERGESRIIAVRHPLSRLELAELACRGIFYPSEQVSSDPPCTQFVLAAPEGLSLIESREALTLLARGVGDAVNDIRECKAWVLDGRLMELRGPNTSPFHPNNE